MAQSSWNSSSRKKAARRRIAVVAAVIATFALALTGLLISGPAFADSRSDALKDKRESEKKIASLRADLDGIDEELADLFIAVEQSKIEVAALQDELAVAEQTLADAERKHQQLVAQLADAEALKAEIDSTIVDSVEKESELSSAVGSMAREMYRGESVSPFQVVVNMEDLGEISTRAAAATALSRAQSNAMDKVRTGLVVFENQAEKQQAVTARITELEAQAEQAALEAEQARDVVASSLGAVEAKLAEQRDLQSQWESQKQTAKEQLEGANTELADAAARIAAIDKQAAADKAAADKKAAEEAAKNPPPSSGGGSSGGGSSGGGSTSGGGSSGGGSSSGSGMFNNPFRFPMNITSYFGWRLHPVLGYYRLHNGTDFGAGCGTTQYATRSGTVAKTGYNSSAGNYVTINHGIVNGKSYITDHYHLSSILVSSGQSVSTSTAIGLTGTTGLSTGCHLHLVLYLDGTPVSILPYM